MEPVINLETVAADFQAMTPEAQSFVMRLIRYCGEARQSGQDPSDLLLEVTRTLEENH